jgi:riboflavin synthase
MFTGLIEAVGTVEEMKNHRLILSRPTSFTDTIIGSSIAVNGVCLSVIDLTSATMSFDVVEETLSKTTLGSLKNGDRVNLERSLKADGRFEGHIVQGHVEGMAKVLAYEMEKSNTNCVLGIDLPKGLKKFCIPKGSIAIHGVSLTIASLKGSTCVIALIPHTLEHTILGTLQPGDLVNIETDMLVRAVLQSHSSSSL